MFASPKKCFTLKRRGRRKTSRTPLREPEPRSRGTDAPIPRRTSRRTFHRPDRRPCGRACGNLARQAGTKGWKDSGGWGKTPCQDRDEPPPRQLPEAGCPLQDLPQTFSQAARQSRRKASFHHPARTSTTPTVDSQPRRRLPSGKALPHAALRGVSSRYLD